MDRNAPRIFKRTCQRMDADLTVVLFGPWRACFIPETEIQGEIIANSPIILNVPGK